MRRGPGPARPAVPAVRTAREDAARTLAPGVTTAVLLDDRDGCRGLRQRRLRFAAGARLRAMAVGLGESWYVTGGAGRLETRAAGTAAPGSVALREGVAVWLRQGTQYRCRADGRAGLEVLATAVFAGSPRDDTGPAMRVAELENCEPEYTGDREFRALLSSGPAGRLAITQFAGLIPPGRAPEHHHTYDEIVHVLAGHGVVHLGDTEAAIGPGTSVYLPPLQPHCLENTGSDLLRVLGVFHPAGSPAAKGPATPTRLAVLQNGQRETSRDCGVSPRPQPPPPIQHREPYPAGGLRGRVAARRPPEANDRHRGGTMTTAEPATQTSRTVKVQDIRLYSLGQRADKAGPMVADPGLGNVVSTFCIAGSSSTQDLLLTITGLSLTTDVPAVVLLQPRQSANQDFGFTDEFAVQVIDTSATQLLVRIQRLDANSGWGQDLRLDIFIVDSVNNP